MAVLHLTCGKIACGKTYFAKNLCADNKAVLFSVDEMMLTLYDECLGENHHDAEIRCVKFLLNIAVNTVKCGMNAVLDHGFWNSDDRKYASLICEDNDIKYEWHYFDTDDFTRMERLKERNKKLSCSKRREYIIDDEMMERFDSWFEPPTI